ncbi:MAG: sugar ABC transporter permease [Anaerolineaceae bacterium]|nr:sugar ABC transporter permease [Anaerolineaceae bacterium]
MGQKSLQSHTLPYIMMAPAMAAMALFILYPIGYSVWLSLHRVDFLRPQAGRPFIGLQNYLKLFSDAAFWNAAQITLVYTTVAVVVSFIIGLATALLLNEQFRGRILARSIVIIPWAVPYVAAILIWKWMLNTDFGIVNYILLKFGLITEGINWLVSPVWAMVAVLIVTVWTQYPFVTMMHLAALQGIAADLQEAATIDGAGVLDRFRYVTWPGLSQVNTAAILLLVIWNFRRFTIIYTMTGGGPIRSTETLVIQTYRQAFSFYNMGYASAIGTVILGVLLAFSLIYIIIQYRTGKEV